jgi:hypothetical protein
MGFVSRQKWVGPLLPPSRRWPAAFSAMSSEHALNTCTTIGYISSINGSTNPTLSLGISAKSITGSQARCQPANSMKMVEAVTG